MSDKKGRDDLQVFFGNFNRFQGRMEKFEQTTEQWQKDMNARLSGIEIGIQTPKVCGAHSSLLEMIANQRETEKRQDRVNINQKTENTEIQKQQNVQNTSIGDLEVATRELKLSNRDLAKVAALVTAISTPVLTIVMYFLDRWFGL